MKHLKNPNVAWWLGHVRDLIIVILIGNLITFLFNPDFDNFLEKVKIGSLYSLFIGGILWKGNQFIGFSLGKKLDIHNQPYKALIWKLSAMFIFSLVAIFTVNYIWHVVIYGMALHHMFATGWLTMLIVFFITVIITSIFFSIGFFKSWKESAVNEEKLQKESIRLQYQALKNQVNPHFLFNSLNSLTSLVNNDQEQAVKFIKQLSEVYRYVLEHTDNELVSLAEEISFSEKYIFLQKIRHGTSLSVHFTISEIKDRYVVPVSLQILIENAIKHNIVSEEHPLFIEIYDTRNTIIIKNNLQPKKTLNDSGGIGLNSIIKRYSFVTDRIVTTKETMESFIVELPFLEHPQS